MKTLFASASLRAMHRFAKHLSLSLFLLAGFSTLAQPGLVAHYSFNGIFFDQTTNGNHAIATGNPAFVADRNDQANSAVSFGGCGNPQFLRVPNSASLQVTNAMTVAFWAKVDLSSGMDPGTGSCNANGRHVFFAKAGDGYGVSPPGILGLTYPQDGQQRVTFESSTNSGQVNMSLAKDLPGPSWHHYVYALTTSEVKLYIDAQLVQTTPAALSFAEANQQDLYLGVMGPKSSPVLGVTNWYPMQGTLDDVRIFNRALGAAEVSTVFASDDAGSCAPAAATILPAGNAVFCEGQSLTLKATNIPPGVALQWQPDGQAIAQGTLDSLVVDQTGTYRLENIKRQDAWKSDISGFKTTMNDVQFLGNTGWIVGEYGLVLKTTDGGGTFDTLTTGRQATLTTVSFVNAQVGYVGGAGGLVLKTTNGGTSWFPLNFPSSGAVRKVQFMNENTGYVLASQPGYNTDGFLYKTTNGGSDWIQVGLPNADKLVDIAFVDTDFGWIASSKEIHTTSDGGISWTLRKNISDCYSKRFIMIHAFNKNTAWAMFYPDGYCSNSTNTLMRTTDGGATWTEHYLSFPYATTPLSSYLSPTDINFRDSQNGYVVAGFSSKIGGSNTWGGNVIYRTQNGGQTWTNIYDNILEADPYAIAFVSPTQALAVGNGGLLLDISNTGTISTRNPQNRTYLPLKTVAGNSSRVFVGGGTINFPQQNVSNPRSALLTKTPGQDWVKTETMIVPPHNGVIGTVYNQIKFKNDKFGWRVAYRTISTTHDGGDTWMPIFDNFGQESPPWFYFYSIEKAYFQNDSTGFVLAAVPTAGLGLMSIKGKSRSSIEITYKDQGASFSAGMLDLQFINNSTGFITTYNGKLIRTTDGGNSWSVQLVKADTPLYRVFFINPQTGWVIGNGGLILKTTDGGSSWAEQTSGTTADLRSILFLSEQEGYVVGGNGTLLKTSNGGNTWVKIETNTPNTLIDIAFINRDEGYIVGESGTILSFNPTLLPDCKTTSAAVNVSLNPGAVCESKANGDWDNATTWSCGHVPLVCDQVVVSHLVTLGQSVQVRAVEIQENGQLAVQGGNMRLEN
ncbi:YCF48-related protein [Persicitalea sp.]|uniref:YCF48-related protein n=1 Tax=Persicitalea sp. TaxID=3100273 RepID=UPI003594221E